MNTPLSVVLVATIAFGGGDPTAAHAQQDPPRQVSVDVCRPESDAASSATSNNNAPAVRGLLRDIDRALALFRFHKPDEARAAVDAARKRLDRAADPGVLAADDDRPRLEAALGALRACVSTATPADMATLTVRTNYLDGPAGREFTRSAGGGVYIRVGNVAVGRTSPDGTLTTQVPSGEILVWAIVPPEQAGQADVRLSPGGTGAVTITLEDKEPSDETDLMLLEPRDGVLRTGTRSLSLQFVVDDQPLAINGIEDVELLDINGVFAKDLADLFTISGTRIVALNPRAVLEALSDSPSVAVRVRVEADGSDGFSHDGVVEFRIERP